MTISAFCRDQLLAQGPLSLETLADLAAGAGKTTARDPAAAVRSALTYKEVLLADGRWATPLWLLEGRILTARRLPFGDAWPEDDLDDTDDDVLAYEPFLENPDLDGVPDRSRHDLTLLGPRDPQQRGPAGGRRGPAQQAVRLRLARSEGLAIPSSRPRPAARAAGSRGAAARRARTDDRRAALGR